MRRSAGSRAEKLAARYLSARGLRTLTLNYHCRQGEIDLIAKDGEFLVFVEVRMRHSDRHGTAVETVTRSKQMRIIHCARHYLMNSPQFSDTPCRFDVVGVVPADNWCGYRFHWLKDAFQFPG
ncbi:MAG: YraN family protein [Pseudomonadales bacterium]|nr:YraN family protein [Pseudomonadales bacterium]